MSSKRERWEEAQRHELEYEETGKDKQWGIPHSLEFWKGYLCIDNIDGRGVEVGCGSNGIYRLAPNIVGVDPIDFSDGCENFKQGMGEDLPFEDKSVDFVICCNALDHCLDPQKVIDEMFRISDKVILWVYTHPRIVGWIMKVVDKMHPYRFTTEDIGNLLEPHSYVVTKKRVYTFFDLHLKYTKSLIVSFKLLIAHVLGVRALLMHMEVQEHKEVLE